MTDTITIYEDASSILEVLPQANGRYILTVHSRSSHRDRWDDDISVEVGAEHMARLGSLVGSPTLVDAAAKGDTREVVAFMNWLARHLKALIIAVNEVARTPREERLDALEAAIELWHADFEKDPVPGSWS